MFGLSDKLTFVLAAVIAAVSIFAAGYWEGYSGEKEKFDAYKAEVKAIAAAQEEKAKQIEAKNQRLFKETQDAYNTKLASLRAYYGLRVTNGSSALSKVPGTTPGVNDYSPDNLPPTTVLASQCAETTLNLLVLQDWLRSINNNGE